MTGSRVVRWLLFTGAALLTAALAWWVLAVLRLEEPGRASASGFGQFALAAVGLAIMIVSPAAKKVFARLPALPDDEQIRLLGEAVYAQWTAAATQRRLQKPAPLPIFWQRATGPVAGPVSAATRRRFTPLPGLAAVGARRLHHGDCQALHAIYGGLGSGRLLLIGPPASGKSAAAILLLLDALRFRADASKEDRARIPVPVLLTPHGWDPDRESVTDWVAGWLAQSYRVFRGRGGRDRAAGLLTAGRIAVFLDGLDEIPAPLREDAVTALSAAPFRLVLLSRSDEAATPTPLAGAAALELRPVSRTDAVDYLLEPVVDPPPAPWRTLTARLLADPPGPATKALNNPLSLSLLRDTYGPTDPVDELLDTTRFPTPEAIDGHLLDRAVTAAYTPRPGQPKPPYSLWTAQRTLRLIATRLERAGTRDLAWWQIPTWTSRLLWTAAIAVTYGTLGGLAVGLTTTSGSRLAAGLDIGVKAGVIVALMTLVTTGSPAGPKRRRLPSPRALLNPFALAAGAGLGLLFGLILVPVGGLAVGAALAIATLVAIPIMIDLGSTTPADTRSDDPLQSWRNDRAACLAIGLTAALTCGLAVGLTAGWLPGLIGGLALLTVAVLMDNGAIRTTLTAAQLSLTARTPPRLMSFLHDAYQRHLLRTVGPLYQFRHAKLQTRLATNPELPSPTPVNTPQSVHTPDQSPAVLGEGQRPSIAGPS